MDRNIEQKSVEDFIKEYEDRWNYMTPEVQKAAPTVSWDQRFLELADHVATWSKDPKTQVGAVIVDEKKRVVSIGYNGFPRGVSDDVDRYEDRPTKHLFVAHAERNALDNAPLMVDGCTMYVPLVPCNECAKSIIQKGITRVVSYVPDRDGDGFHWNITSTMFIEAGVELFLIDRLANQE